MLYDQFLEKFDKFNEIVKLIDTKLHGRCELRVMKGQDNGLIKAKYWYKPGRGEDDNNMLTLMLEENCIRCWYDYLSETNSDYIKNYFLDRSVKLCVLWDTKQIELEYGKDHAEKIAEATSTINKLLDVWETGIKIREKMEKQLDINISKFFF